jgi:hypothetical protein
MITKYNDILTEELYKELTEYVDLLMKEKPFNFTSSTLTWDNGLKGNSTPILRYDFDKKDTEIFNKVKNEVEIKIPYFIENFCLHVWPNLSYITWHNDYHRKAALTIYLNEKWDKNWGGYLMYEINDNLNAIKPERNLGVLQENSIEHTVTTINTGADLRLSLQFFLTKTKKVL